MGEFNFQKSEEDKGHSASKGNGKLSTGPREDLKFKDSRPGSITQRKLQEQEGKSAKTQELRQLKKLSDNQAAGKSSNTPSPSNNSTQGLPNNLKSGIEQLSGIAMDDVKVNYNSPKPTQLQAHAYAQGSDIHLASGQEKHLPHEAWHVAQQKKGIVSPNNQTSNGTPINDNPGLEREADMMGQRAMEMGSKNITGASENPVQRKRDNTETIQLKSASLSKVKLHGSFLSFRSKFNNSTRQKINNEIERWNKTCRETGFDEKKYTEKKLGILESLLGIIEGKLKEEKKKSEDLSSLKAQILEQKRILELADIKVDGTDLTAANDDRDAQKFDEKRDGSSIKQTAKDVFTHKHNIDPDDSSKILAKKGGDVGEMKSHVADIVKDVQVKEGRIKGIDGKVQADLGTNSYFLQKQEELDEKGWGSPYVKDVAEPALYKQAVSTYKSDFRSKVTGPGGKVGDKVLITKLKPYVDQGKSNSKVSFGRVKDSGVDRVIVEMFYNQVEQIHKDLKSEKDENKKKQLTKEAQSIIRFGVERQKNTVKRFKAQTTLEERLQEDGRVGGLGDKIKNAVSGAILNGIFKALTAGYLSYTTKVDNRGIKAKQNLFVGEDKVAKEENVEGGLNGAKMPWTKVKELKAQMAEVKGKMLAHGKGNETAEGFSNFAVGVQALKDFIGKLNEVASTVLYFSVALSLVPALTPIMISIGLVCSTINMWSAVVRTGLSSIIFGSQALAQMLNNNPHLFNTLESRTKTSGVAFAADATNLGSQAGWGTSEASGVGKGSGKGFEDTLMGTNKTGKTGALLGSENMHKAGKVATGTGGSTLVGLGTKLSSSIGAEDGNLDYSGKGFSAKEKVSSPEFQMIKKSFETTKAKLETDKDEVYGKLFKFKPKSKPPKPDKSKLDKKGREAGKGLAGIGSLASQVAKRARELKK